MLAQHSGVQSDVTVIVRSANERTRDLSHYLLCDQIPKDNIVVISEYPFTRALRSSFKRAIDLMRPWTLCVDADMLLRRNSVQTLLSWASEADSKTFQVQGHLFDKMFCGPRRAGPRLYRTSLLPKALDCLPSDHISVRPEAFVCKQMATLGYLSIHKHLTLGLHDFEQYYRDIYRKAFVYAHKHAVYLHHLEPLWQRLAGEDPDYRVALWGLRDGRLSHGTVSLDARCFPQDLSPQLDRHGLREKNELAPQEIATWDVGSVITRCYRARILAETQSLAGKENRTILLIQVN